GENLGLSLLELSLGDDAAILQVRELGKLVGAAAGARGITHVRAELLLVGLLLADAPFLHRTAPGDEVNQDAEERQDNDEDEPERFGPSAQVLAAENVEDYPEEQEDPQHPEEEPQHRQERVEQRVLHLATIHGQERRNSERPHVCSACGDLAARASPGKGDSPRPPRPAAARPPPRPPSPTPPPHPPTVSA